MNYPLLQEYIESVSEPEDYFDQLAHLRLVTNPDGSPVMSSGNFAVVFKMQDPETGRYYAVKCFTRDQEGREDSYRMIADELEFTSSLFLTPVKYFEKELFVDTEQTDVEEFPVVLMHWVEGVTLDKFVRNYIDDRYRLARLCFSFSKLAEWLAAQRFAHGDIKPDNILVKDDGSAVLVDYDGMYVPAMSGQNAREQGSPDFRHPRRSELPFDEHIDDFSLASILLSLKAISLEPDLLEIFGAQDRLLFSESDYMKLSECDVLGELFPSDDAELNKIYSLFLLSHTMGSLNGISHKLFSLSRPSRQQGHKSVRRKPVRKKCVCEHLVSFDDFDKFCESTGRNKPSDEGRERGSNPVVNVSWNDVDAYCKWAGVRLPSAEERELSGHPFAGLREWCADNDGSKKVVIDNNGRNSLRPFFAKADISFRVFG